METPKSYVNSWDERFDDKQYVYGKQPNVFVDQFAKLLPNGNTLAIAEGEGRNAVHIAGLGHDVMTWDYAPSALKKTNALAKEMGVHIKTELHDLEHAPWEDDKWDNIVNVFGHFEEPLRKRTLTQIKKAVKSGGYYLTEVYSIHQLEYKTGGPRDISMLYRPEEFLETFSDWKILHFFTGEVERYEGKFHTGKSHVIQFLGQKR